MSTIGHRAPQQARSQQTLERILASSTSLMSKKSYEDVSIAEIAEHARISVGGFYTRFENKDALFGTLLNRLGRETDDKIETALARNWSKKSLHDLLHFIVANNAELYEKYRGILIVVHVRTRLMQTHDDDAHRAYNEHIVTRIENLLLRKRDEISGRQPRVAIRLAIACMSAMLRDAIVFGDTRLYPKPGGRATVARHVANIVHTYLAGEVS